MEPRCHTRNAAMESHTEPLSLSLGFLEWELAVASNGRTSLPNADNAIAAGVQFLGVGAAKSRQGDAEGEGSTQPFNISGGPAPSATADKDRVPQRKQRQNLGRKENKVLCIVMFCLAG